jgi:hypothetical protein
VAFTCNRPAHAGLSILAGNRRIKSVIQCAIGPMGTLLARELEQANDPDTRLGLIWEAGREPQLWHPEFHAFTSAYVIGGAN